MRPQSPSAPRAGPPVVPPVGRAQSPRAPAVAPVGAVRPPAPSQTKEAAVTVRGSEPEPPEGGWDSADTVTSFPDPNALPEPSRDVPQVNVREAAPVSTTSPSFTAPTRERTAAQAIAAAQPQVAAPGPARQQTSPHLSPPTQAQPSTQAAPTNKMGPAGSASLAAPMREEVWAIVRAAVNEATAPLIARNKELEARIDRAEKEIIARTTGAARGNTAPMQATPAPAGGSAAARLANIGSNSIPIAVSASVAPPQVSPGAPPVPKVDTAPASVTRPEFRIDAPMVLPGPRASIPPQGLGVAVMTVQRPSLDLESVGAVDVSEFDGGRKKRVVARIFVVVLLAIVTGCVVAMIASRS